MSGQLSALRRRHYSGPHELPQLREFAGTALAGRLPSHGYWHPGDISWMLVTHAHKGLFDPYADVAVWRTGTRVVALAWFYAAGHVRWAALAGVDAGPVLEWCEQRNRTRGQRALSTLAFDDDEGRCALLAARGYECLNTHVEHALAVDLAAPLAAPVLPPGYTLGHCVDMDIGARAACHRRAWSSLGHIGRPLQRSDFSHSIHAALRAAPGYQAAGDLVVWAPDGSLAACCICWTDDISRVGIFEPVGVTPEHRGLGLTSALNAAGFAWLRATGMQRAQIMQSMDTNPAALAAYGKLFKDTGVRQHVWLRR